MWGKEIWPSIKNSFPLYSAAATVCKHIIEKGDAKSKAEDFADAPEDADTGVLQEA